MNSRSILIITSNKDNLDFFAVVLSQEGFNILKAESSASGLDMAIKERPDLIVIDGREFNGDGYEILEEIKKHQIPTRVIVCPVAHDFSGRIISFIQIGICDYLTLPIAIETLVSAVKRALTLDNTILHNPTPIVEKLLIRMKKLEQAE